MTFCLISNGALHIRIIFVYFLGWNAVAFGVQAVAGDNAPRGARDGVLNAADLVVMERFVLGLETPTEEELKVADVAPVGGPADGVLNVADLLVLERAVLGLVILPPVNLGPDAPLLNPNTCPVEVNPCAISGTAEINSIVHIYVNNVEQAPVPADASGVFTASIPLLDGDNSVYAITEVDSDFSPVSNILTVNYLNNISRTQGGTILQNTVWTPGADTTYTITSNLIIPIGVTLTIQPGVKLIINSGINININAGGNMNVGTGVRLEFAAANARVYVSGLLTAIGAVDSPVVFTRSASNVGLWGGITVLPGGNVEIKYATIEYASIGIDFNAGSSPASNPSHVTYSSIRNNSTGIYTRGDGINLSKNSMPIVNYCAFYGNGYAYGNAGYANASSTALDARYNWWGSVNLVTINSSILSRVDYLTSSTGTPESTANIDISPILDKEGGEPYANVLMDYISSEIDGSYLAGIFIVPAGSTFTVLEGSKLTFSTSGYIKVKASSQLILQPGVRMEMASGSSVIVEAYGALTVQGSAASPVVFTGIEKISGTWSKIQINENAWLSMTYAIVEGANNGIYFDNSSGEVSHTIIRNNIVGIMMLGSSNPTISNSNISQNGTGIQFGFYSTRPSPSPSIHNNNIYANTSAGIFIYYPGGTVQTPSILDLTGNWWGAAIPPANSVKGSVTGFTLDYSSPLSSAVTAIDPLISTFAVTPKLFSPNGDTQLDTALFSANMSGLRDWNLSITKDSQVLRTYSGSSTNLSQEWDGLDNAGILVPDGQYIARLVAYDAGTSQSVGMQVSVNVDTSAPVAMITSPLENANVFNDVSIIGMANDTRDFASYQLEVGSYLTQGGGQVLQWQTLVNSTTPKVNTSLGAITNTNSWEDSQSEIWPNGQILIRLTAKDTSGNQTQVVRTVNLNNLEIAGVTAQNRIFQPLGGQSSTISFDINRSANIIVRIHPELVTRNLYPNQTIEDSVVRTIDLGQMAAGNHTVQWDGKDDAGQYVADDVYIFMIEATDAEGGFDKYSPSPMSPAANVTVYYQADSYLTNEYIKENFNPYKNQFLSFTLDTSDSTRNPDQLPVRMGMALLSSGKEYSNDFYKPYPASEFTAYIDGHTAAGQILPINTLTMARLTGGYWTSINNTQLVSVPIVNSGNGVYKYLRVVSPNYLWAQGTTATVPVPSLKSDPYQVDLSYGQVQTEFSYSLDQDADVTVKVLSPDLEHEWVLINNESQSSGDHTVVWDPIPSETGAEPGYYTLSVTANHPVTGHGVTRHANITIYR
jgi:flagellar hook assembly protein FlgD